MRYLFLLLAFTLLVSCEEDDENMTDDDVVIVEPLTYASRVQVQGGNTERGYYVITPTNSTSTFLLSTEGFIVYRWESTQPGFMAYLRPDGGPGPYLLYQQS